LIEGVAVDVAVRVAACTRIAIPVPSSADAVALLEHGNVQVELVAQRVQHVHAGKAGANDDCIKDRLRASPLRTPLYVCHDNPPDFVSLVASLISAVLSLRT